MKIEATLAKIEAAIEKRAESLADAVGEDLKRLEEEIEGLLDFGHKIQQHPAVAGGKPEATPAAEEPAPTAAPEGPAVPADVPAPTPQLEEAPPGV